MCLGVDGVDCTHTRARSVHPSRNFARARGECFGILCGLEEEVGMLSGREPCPPCPVLD